jgi:hypothetical protein
MWNSGMTLRQRSDSVRLSVDRMFAAEAQRFRCDKRIIFGRAVVPDV